jgi:hypothetical protein
VNIYGRITGDISKNFLMILRKFIDVVSHSMALTKPKQIVTIILKYRLAESNQEYYKICFL